VPDEDFIEEELVTSGDVVDIHVIPDPGAVSYDRDLAQFESCADQDCNVAELVQWTGADVVDGGHRQDVCFHAEVEAGFCYDNVGGTLGVWNMTSLFFM
jgi:hypothetical protein